MDHSAHDMHDHAAMMADATTTTTAMPAVHDHAKMVHDGAPMVATQHSFQHSMAMAFHFNYDNELVLFSFWQIHTLTGLLASCAIIIVMSIVYEAVKWCRVRLDEWHADQLNLTTLTNDESTEVLQGVETGGEVDGVRRAVHNNGIVRVASGRSKLHHPFIWRCMQSLLYGAQLILSYFLMLIFMTYNVWLSLAVILGAMLGNCIFSRSADVNNPRVLVASDHCH